MFSKLCIFLILLQLLPTSTAKIIIPSTTASKAAIKKFHPIHLKHASHKKVFELSRGGNIDAPNDSVDDPYDDNQESPSKPKLLKPNSGWSLLSAFRMHEEALIEMADDSDDNENNLRAKKISGSKKKQNGKLVQQSYEERLIQDDKSRRRTIVGGAGVVTTNQSSATKEESYTKKEKGSNVSLLTQRQKSAKFTFSPGTVATAASRLINEYVENESPDEVDYDSYEEYEYDDDFNIDSDENEVSENIVESAGTLALREQTVTQHVEIISLHPADDLREGNRMDKGLGNSRREKLENMVEESQMKDIRKMFFPRQPVTRKQISVSVNDEQHVEESDNIQNLAMKQSRTVLSPLSTIESNSEPLLLKDKPDKFQKSVQESAFVSSGYWNTIDKMASFGLSSNYSSLRLSKKLRGVRKATARVTGLHGFVSGKTGKSNSTTSRRRKGDYQDEESLNEEALGVIRRKIAAIDDAKERLGSRIEKDEGLLKGRASQRKVIVTVDDMEANARRVGVWRRPFRLGRRGRVQNGGLAQSIEENLGEAYNVDILSQTIMGETKPVMSENEITISVQEDEIRRQRRAIEVAEDIKRKARVQEIDRLILEGQNQMVELQCEKDFLQRRPNPLFNYTSEDAHNVTTSRAFNFPPSSLVDEYIEELKSTCRLIMLDHTSLWKGESENNEDDESIGDDLFTPSADANKLYMNENNGHSRRKKNNNNLLGGGGSWLLRQTIGKGVTLGEKLGETVEVAAYQAVCSAVMSVLARSISAMHGTNVMEHSDIRLHLDQSPDLPPVGKDMEANTYAQDKIKQAIQRGSKRNKGKNKHSKHFPDAAFIQRDAVAETLISHCQISAPLLKLFPLNWQRAMLANIITLITAITSDFCAGMKFQILGHELSLSFQPITEKDIIRHIGQRSFNNRGSKPEEFEYAVSVTARDLSDKMTFLDRWHHRVLGSGMLRAQIGNLIARIVLTLVDDVLCGATMDLWSAQAGGPRVIAGLEYRLDEDNNSSRQ